MKNGGRIRRGLNSSSSQKMNDKLERNWRRTPIDPILIIAQESSSPKSFKKPEELDWKMVSSFHTP